MSLEVEVRAPTEQEKATAASWPIWTKEVSEFEEAISGINSGNCALFIDTLNIAFDIDRQH